MPPNSADIPAFVALILEKRDTLKRELDELDRVISGLDSWYTSAFSIVSSPQNKKGISALHIPANGHAVNGSLPLSGDIKEVPIGGETLTGRIVALLDKQPERTFSPVEITHLLDISSDDVHARTSYLVKNKRIRKVGRGMYQSVDAKPTVARLSLSEDSLPLNDPTERW